MFKASEKPKKLKTEDFEINTVIAAGITIEGDLVGDDSLRIDGKVKGNIQVSQGVVIGEAGTVEGNVQCESIIVFGKTLGNIHAHTLNLKPSGYIDGDVLVKLLSIDLGGRINGLIDMSQEKETILLEPRIEQIS